MVCDSVSIVGRDEPQPPVPEQCDPARLLGEAIAPRQERVVGPASEPDGVGVLSGIPAALSMRWEPASSGSGIRQAFGEGDPRRSIRRAIVRSTPHSAELVVQRFAQLSSKYEAGRANLSGYGCGGWLHSVLLHFDLGLNSRQPCGDSLGEDAGATAEDPSLPRGHG